MPVLKEEKQYAAKVVRALARLYPDAGCSLEFGSPLELLVATILSAQCTDQRVNIVTKDLFQKYHSAADYAAVGQSELERAIKSTGFFRNKAKNIRACCRSLEQEHNGQVPADIDALVTLSGVGRKTANVVLGTAFGIASGIVVDTHVGRISRRLGLSTQKDAVRVEKDLIQRIAKPRWVDFSHRMIRHGRQLCTARKPQCDRCPMASFCPRIGVAST